MHQESNELNPKTKKIISCISIVLFLFIMLFLGWLIGGPMLRFVSEPEGFRRWVDGHGLWGPVIYVAMMALQIIVAIIPAGPLEMAAGYAFGTIGGTLLCMAGSLIGSLIVFLFVRRFGYKAVDAFISRDKINSLRFMKDHRRLDLLVFIFFLIPGAPKDVLTYFVGLTRMKLGRFLLLTTIARIPTFAMTVLSGSALEGQRYTLAIIILGVTMGLCAVGLLIYRSVCRRHTAEAGAAAGAESNAGTTADSDADSAADATTH